MLQYRKIEHDLLLLREQLLLFEVGKKNGATPAHDDSEDWDYASADTKTETHGIHPYPAMMIPQVTRRLIRMYGTEGQTLLDPFCG
jgi:DNA modification methylase